MRTCENCDHENPDGIDFCEKCGLYLRWEPTNHQMPAVRPTARDDAAKQQQPAPAQPGGETPRSTTIRPAAPQPRRRPAPEQGRTAALPPQPPTRPRAGTPRSSAGITLRLPDDEPSAVAGMLGIAVVSGERARVVALVRNEDSIVDNYTLAVHGLPREWYTIVPETVYLVPFGSAGSYEQDVEIHIHPPRTRAGAGAALGAERGRRVARPWPRGRRRADDARHPPLRGLRDPRPS